MAIQKRFIHFKKFSDFNSKKLSANEANTQYTVGVSGAIQDGEPDILYQSYVWIKDTKQQWTHAQLYGNDSTVDLTYEELKSLRDSAQLIPGRQYRIIDYNTTTSQKNTKSAEHQFDIIVTALNEYTLSEEAQAIQNTSDGYFDDSNLSAWKIWYSLDNDTERFAWAGDERIETAIVNAVDTSNCTISVGYSYDDEEGLNKFDERVHFISQMWDDPTNEPYFEGNDIDELITHWGYEEDPYGIENCLTLYGLNLEIDEETEDTASDDNISECHIKLGHGCHRKRQEKQ